MELKGLIGASFIDWPGSVCAIVFTGGCNFRCPFCHNHELVLNPTALPSRTGEQILDDLAEDIDWLDGITISGGEPTLQPDLADFCKLIKKTGLKVKLDTNGTKPAVLMDLLNQGLLDAVSMDLKAPLDGQQYAFLTGVPVDLDKIRASIGLLLEADIDLEFRTTFVPQRQTEADLAAMAADLTGAAKWRINSFKPDNCLSRTWRSLPPVTKEEHSRLQALANDLLAQGRDKAVAA